MKVVSDKLPGYLPLGLLPKRCARIHPISGKITMQVKKC